ncbi:hypothetical protein [Sphaerospermopsis sp. FACHB-1194]|uniref:hypothetical protein n=1 Tax=Sphaerospermopsis sp. FACHB-1194 TaxID=2692862 RepID=UPI0016803DCD|nr:hypothetical protein [Sphaerospermopsis sp. FACHB-1194]MBD2148471.1 hypothetical protein [Sphaerospermopsis sp. FACHB-1194]
MVIGDWEINPLKSVLTLMEKNKSSQSPVPSPQSPVPSPQSPVPSPQSPVPSPQYANSSSST